MRDRDREPDDWTRAPFVRVFATLPRDHPAVWVDDRLLAWYVRLLLRADQAWPGHAEFPRALPVDVEAALVEAAAIDPSPVIPGGYQVHGMARLRGGIAARGQAGGLARAQGAPRDSQGRMLAADAGVLAAPSAGRTNGNAGPVAGPVAGLSAGPAVAGSFAGVPANQHQRTSHETVKEDVATPPHDGVATSSVEATTTRARAGEAGLRALPDPAVRDPYPPTDCKDPTAHKTDHRRIAGAWRCPVCTAGTRDASPSFRDRVPWPPALVEEDSDGSPF